MNLNDPFDHLKSFWYESESPEISCWGARYILCTGSNHDKELFQMPPCNSKSLTTFISPACLLGFSSSSKQQQQRSSLQKFHFRHLLKHATFFLLLLLAALPPPTLWQLRSFKLCLGKLWNSLTWMLWNSILGSSFLLLNFSSSNVRKIILASKIWNSSWASTFLSSNGTVVKYLEVKCEWCPIFWFQK